MGSYQKWCHKVFKQASIGIRFDEMLTGIGFQRVDLFAVCCFALFPRRESSNNMFGLKCIYVFTSTFQQQVNIFTELNSTIQKNETFVFRIQILTWVLIRGQANKWFLKRSFQSSSLFEDRRPCWKPLCEWEETNLQSFCEKNVQNLVSNCCETIGKFQKNLLLQTKKSCWKFFVFSEKIPFRCVVVHQDFSVNQRELKREKRKNIRNAHLTFSLTPFTSNKALKLTNPRWP